MKKIRICLLVLFFINLNVKSVYAKGFVDYLTWGTGTVITMDFEDAMKEFYDNTTLVFLWANLELGLQLPVTKKLFVNANMGTAWNVFKVSLITSRTISEEWFFEYMFIPNIRAQFRFFEAGPTIYIGGEVNYNIPRYDVFQVNSKGIGYGGYAGYSLGEGMGIEIGYRFLPVEVIPNSTIERNFGGFALSLKKSF